MAVVLKSQHCTVHTELFAESREPNSTQLSKFIYLQNGVVFNYCKLFFQLNFSKVYCYKNFEFSFLGISLENTAAVDLSTGATSVIFFHCTTYNGVMIVSSSFSVSSADFLLEPTFTPAVTCSSRPSSRNENIILKKNTTFTKYIKNLVNI